MELSLVADVRFACQTGLIVCGLWDNILWFGGREMLDGFHYLSENDTNVILKCLIYINYV